MDVAWCLYCRNRISRTDRSLHHPVTHSSAFCSSACEASAALSHNRNLPLERNANLSRSRPHQASPSRTVLPPSTTERLTNSRRRATVDAANAQAINELAHELDSVLLTTPSSAEALQHAQHPQWMEEGEDDDNDDVDDELQVYGRGHDRAYYGGSDPLPTGGMHHTAAGHMREERAAEEDRTKTRPIIIKGDLYDLDARKKRDEHRGLGSWEGSWVVEHDRAATRRGEGDREGRKEWKEGRREGREERAGMERGRRHERRVRT